MHRTVRTDIPAPGPGEGQKAKAACSGRDYKRLEKVLANNFDEDEQGSITI